MYLSFLCKIMNQTQYITKNRTIVRHVCTRLSFFCENREDKPEQIDYNKKKDTR